MSTDHRNASVCLENAIASGKVTRRNLEQSATWLREEGYGAIEATKALRSVFQVSLAVAKDVILTHPAWEDVATASLPVRAVAIEALLAFDGAQVIDDEQGRAADEVTQSSDEREGE